MKVMLSTWTVYPFHGFGGVERYYYNLARNLQVKGIDATVITSGRRRSEKRDGINFEVLEPDVHSLPLRQFWMAAFGKNVSKFLRKKEFDLLHGTEGTYPYSAIRPEERKPVLMHCIGLAPFQDSNLWIRRYNFTVAYRRNYNAYHAADAVAAEGEPQKRELERIFKIPHKSIRTLHAGIYTKEIADAIKESNLTRQKIGVDDADIVLINVNRLAANKGVPYLIDALAKLNKKMNAELNVKLILVGSGPDEEKIKRQINNLQLGDKVKHFKNIPDRQMYQLLGLADISVTPTLFEGLPTVVLEAMAAGKPIVATDISQMRQVVHNGKNGFIVQRADSDAIVHAVMKIHEKKLKMKMGVESKRLIKDYDWRTVAKDVVKVYEDLIRK